MGRLSSLLSLCVLAYGCSGHHAAPAVELKYKATGGSPMVLAQYEPWFGFSKHISVGYSSDDPAVIHRQIQQARTMGIAGFVADWYGDREPFIDKSYSVLQSVAGKENFKVAMMYVETEEQDDATDEAIADLTMFHNTYLLPKSPGHEAYLMYQGHPLIFIFPTHGHTDWNKVRAVVNKWSNPPLLINEYPPGQYTDAFDGYYAWISPGPKGWQPDGSNWGELYLQEFYTVMTTKYPNKIIVGGAWSQFDDSKASWSLNRHMSARCGQTYQQTFNFWKRYLPPTQVIPFMMIETWNDYEEGSDIEPGIPSCKPASASTPAPAR